MPALVPFFAFFVAVLCKILTIFDGLRGGFSCWFSLFLRCLSIFRVGGFTNTAQNFNYIVVSCGVPPFFVLAFGVLFCVALRGSWCCALMFYAFCYYTIIQKK